MSSPRPRLSRGEPLHQQIARHIRNEIDAGVWRDGETLPSTRELAADWDVSVFTVTEAMRTLAEEGMVVNKSRSKRIVRVPDQRRRVPIRLRQPNVLLIGGYAGSGKTELGRILARATGWPILDKDTLTRPVVEAALEIMGRPPHDRESETYLKLVRPREYESLIAAAEENIECGNSAIVTAPFIQEFSDERWTSSTATRYTAMGAATTLVWIRCDPDTMHTYLRRRGAARDAAKLADWPGYAATIDPEFRPAAEHILVDNRTLPLQEQADQLLKTVLGAEAA